MDSVLHLLYNPTLHIIICGDTNIDYLKESERKNQLDNLLLTYNITSIITFPTRLQNTSATATDNMFLDTTRFEDYTVIPITNGLCDHDAQLLTIKTKVTYRPVSKLKTIKKFNNCTIADFINKLNNESWDMVFNSEDINNMFNSFFNDYLRIFNSSFPLHTVTVRKNLTKNKWITKGIKISCNNKRKLYLACRQNTNEEIKQHYQLYSKILANVIREAKTIYYNKKILKSHNKYKTTWDVIKEVTGHQRPKIEVQDMKVENELITDLQEIAEVFSDYFTFKKDKDNMYKIQNRLNNITTRNCCFYQNYIHPSSSFVFKTFSTKKISSIIKSIKTKNTCGYDRISTKLLKASLNYITSSLTYICNKVILSGIFLD